MNAKHVFDLSFTSSCPDINDVMSFPTDSVELKCKTERKENNFCQFFFNGKRRIRLEEKKKE